MSWIRDLIYSRRSQLADEKEIVVRKAVDEAREHMSVLKDRIQENTEFGLDFVKFLKEKETNNV